jgi:hypothetical protein
MIGRSFRECLGGFAACGLLRKNFSPSSALYRPLIRWVHCFGWFYAITVR